MWDDVVEEDKPAEAAPAADPAADPAAAPAADGSEAPKAEVAEPPPPENTVHGTDPKRLVCKHWVR